MSTKPGVTRAPSASISRSPRSSMSPTATTLPPATPTSAVRGGAPVPSTTVPPRMISSSISASPVLLCPHPRSPERGEHLVDQPLPRLAGVVPVETEAAAHHEHLGDPELCELLQAVDAVRRRPRDPERV